MDSNSKFQLWSPPLLDLSLDSFSNDLIQEFDKTRSTVQSSGKDQQKNDEAEQKNLEETTENLSTSVTLQSPNSNTLHIMDNNENVTNFSSTLPQQPSEEQVEGEAETEITEQENEDDQESSAANLFRKSSTFLKKKLQTNRNSTVSTSPSSIITATTTTTSAEISSIVSRQYPPKPLQYSSIVEPASDDIKALARKSNGDSINSGSVRNSRDSAHVLTKTLTTTVDQPNVMYQTAAKPMTITVAPAVETPKVEEEKNNQTKTVTVDRSVATTTTPKRRSFFSLRFC